MMSILSPVARHTSISSSRRHRLMSSSQRQAVRPPDDGGNDRSHRCFVKRCGKPMGETWAMGKPSKMIYKWWAFRMLVYRGVDRNCSKSHNQYDMHLNSINWNWTNRCKSRIALMSCSWFQHVPTTKSIPSYDLTLRNLYSINEH